MEDKTTEKKVTRLRFLRLEKGLSAEELAKLAGVARSTIFRYENFTTRPSRKATIKLCRALGVDEINTDLTELVEVNAKWIADGRTKTF